MQTDERAMDQLELLVLVYSEFVIVPIDAVLPLPCGVSRSPINSILLASLSPGVSSLVSSPSHPLTHAVVCLRESYSPSHSF